MATNWEEAFKPPAAAAGGVENWEARFSPNAQPKDNSSDIIRGGRVALGQTVPLLKGTAGLIGATAENLLGEGGYSTQLKNWGLQGYQQGMAKLQPLQQENDELTTAWAKAKDGDIGALIDWAAYGLGYSLGQLGEAAVTSVAGGVLGGLAGGPLGAGAGAGQGLVARGAVKELASNLIEAQVAKEALRIADGRAVDASIRQLATKEVTKRLGSNAGLGAFVFTQEAGSIYPEAENQAQEQGRQLDGGDLARVWGSALAAAGVEGLTERLKLDALQGKVLLPFAGKGAGTGAAARVAGGLAGATVGVAGEASTEALQTMIERYGAGQNLTDAEAIKDYINSAGLGGLGGGAVGLVSGALYAPEAAAAERAKADKAQAAADAKAAEAQATAARILNSPTVDDAIAAAREATAAALRDKTAAPLPPGPEFDVAAQQRVDLANERANAIGAVGPAIGSQGQSLITDEEALARSNAQRQAMQAQATAQQTSLQRSVGRVPGATDAEGPPLDPASQTRTPTAGELLLNRRAEQESRASTGLAEFDRQQAQSQINASMAGQTQTDVVKEWPAGRVPMTLREAKQKLALLSAENPDIKIERHPSVQTVTDGRGLKQPAFVLRVPPRVKPPAAARAPNTLTTPEQQGLAEKSVVGTFAATLKAGSAQLKAAGDLILRRVTERGGVASPSEADLLLRAGLGKPYDRIDPALDGQAELGTDQRPRDDKGDISGPAPATSPSPGPITGDPGLTGATGIALDKAKRVREHFVPPGPEGPGGWQDRRPTLAADAPPVVPDTLPVSAPLVTGLRRAGVAMPTRPEPPVITADAPAPAPPEAPPAPPVAPGAPAPAGPQSELRTKLQLNTHNPALEAAVKAAARSQKPSAIKAVFKELAKSTNPVIAYLGEHLGRAINPAYKFIPWSGGRGRYGSHLRVSMGAELKIQPRNVAKRYEGFEDDEHAVAHELMHAMTVNNYHTPRTAEHRQAKLELQELARQAKAALQGETDPDTRGHVGSKWYGTLGVNIDTLTKEFLAEAFTNPSFQARLDEIPYGDMSLWTKFVKALAKILGLDKPSMLTEALRLGEALSDKKRRADPVGRSRREAPVWEQNADDGQETVGSDRRPSAIAQGEGVPGEARPTGTARESTSAYGTGPWYSDLTRALEGLSTKAAPAEGWKQAIKALVAKSAGMGDEVEWSGTNEWLDLQQGKVTREAVLAYLDANGVKVIETTRREAPPPPPTMRDTLRDTRRRIEDGGYHVIEDTIEGETPDTFDRGIFLLDRRNNEDADEDTLPADVARDLAFLREHINDPRETRGDLRGWTVENRDRLDELEANNDRTEDEDAERQALIRRENEATPGGASEPKLPRHGDKRLQLPGGKNYRELLLILSPKPDKIAGQNKLDDAKILRQGINPTSGRPYVQFTWHGQTYAVEHLATESVENAMLQRINAPTGRGAGEVRPYPGEVTQQRPRFTQGHWEEEDVLAHIRLNDRTDVDGKRVLFVEEIQSDWAQRGGTDGFGQQPRYTVRDTNGHVRGDFTTRDAAQAYLDNPPERMRHLFDHTARVVQVGQARVERAVAAEREADDTLEAAKSLLLKYKGDLAEANATHRRAGEQARTADEVEAAMQWLTKAKLKHELQTSVLKEANVTLIAAMRERDEAQAATTMGTGTPVAPFVAKREFAVFKDGAEVKRIDKDGKPQTERYGSMELAQAAAQKKGGEARDMGYGEHTDAWVALAIKRVLKLAVDEGYDKVAFINGQQSADRYGLTQVFDQLMYVHNQTDDTYTLGVKRVGAHENDAFQTEVGGRDMRVLKAADLPGYVDKELADKIVAGEGVRGTFGGAAHYVDYAVGPAIIGDGQVVFGVRADGTRQMVDANAADPEAKARELRRELGARGPLVLKGIDLKVGGEDMKVFYDSIVPKIATRISKKLGGGAMGVVNIQVGKNFETRSRSEAERDGGSFGRVEAPAMGDQPSIDITDKMREQAAGGVPLFARQSQGAYSGADGQAPAQQAPGPGDGSALPGAAARADDGVRGAAGAVPDRAARGDRAGSGRRTLGLGIAERIERTGHEALNGAIVRGPQDLADLAQVFRDPRYETFRVFFVKGNTIVHSTGVSSRSVDATSAAPAGVSSQEYHQRMKDMKDSTKADGYYILHNHPSGEPTASKEDIELTASLAAAVPGLMAHVIVNSNKWGLIEPDSSGAITTAETHIRQFGEDKLLQASKPLAVLGRALGKAEDLAVLGKAVQKPGYITLIGTDAGNRVRVVTEVPSDVLKRSDKYLLALVRRVKRLSGSANMHAVGSDSDMASEPIVRALTARVLRDALPETGLPLSKRIAQVPKKDAPSIESPAREAKGPDVLADNYKGLEGKKVDMPVRLADTGETGTLTLDAAGALRDYDDRIGALRRLTECLA